MFIWGEVLKPALRLHLVTNKIPSTEHRKKPENAVVHNHRSLS